MRALLLLPFAFACGDDPLGSGVEEQAAEDADFDGHDTTTDCNDEDATVNPDAEELCDGIDNNCDDTVDEGVRDTWYADLDADGFGDPDNPIDACTRPDGYVPNTGDCDDSSDQAFPGADEICDSLDNDCDGELDPASCRPLQSADARILGESAGDEAGFAVAGPGDIDGDGLADILIGAPSATHNGPSSGAAYYFRGPVLGDREVTEADAWFLGPSLEDGAGYALTGAGDINRDGYGEIAIGAWGDPEAGSFGGAVWVFQGPLEGALTPENALAHLIGEGPGDSAGLAVGNAGDVNGDGYADLLIGAPNEDSYGISAGAAYLQLGPFDGEHSLAWADARFYGDAEADYAGRRVGAAGDMNGDGIDDIFITAYGDDSGGAGAGSVYLFHGPVTGDHMLNNADAFVVGENDGDHAGSDAAAAGDMNGDGYLDLVVGSPDQSDGGTGAGAAYLVTGPVDGTLAMENAHARLLGRMSWDHAGNAVDGPGDVNGDGARDLLIGAYIEDSGGINAGAAYLVHGPVTGTRYLHEAEAGFIGEADGDLAGWSARGPGDVDGDGMNDLILGAPGNDHGGDDAGIAYVVYASEL